MNENRILIIILTILLKVLSLEVKCVDNDNYCDCPNLRNSQEESETGACSFGIFKCLFISKISLSDQSLVQSNLVKSQSLKVPLEIPSSYILDGVCDCCDCSDETGGWVPLVNHCEDSLNKLRSEIKSSNQNIEKGQNLKVSLIEKARLKKLDNKASLASKSSKLQSLQNDLNLLKVDLESATERERVEFEVSEKKRAETCPEIQSLANEKTAHQVLRDDYSKISLKVIEKDRDIDELKQKYTTLFEAMKAFAPAEELAKYDLNPPPPIPDSTAGSEDATSSPSPEPTEHVVNNDAPTDSQQEQQQNQKQEKQPEFTPDCLGRVFGLCVPTLLLPLSKKAGMIKEASSIQSTINDHNSQISTLEREIRELEELKEYGPSDEWLALEKECISLDVLEYTYKVCIMGAATQTKIGESYGVNLGDFSSFDNDFKTLKYENGQKCWNGPSRSITVAFSCGPETKLLDVNEPAMCTYTASATSPLACPLPQKDTNSEL